MRRFLAPVPNDLVDRWLEAPSDFFTESQPCQAEHQKPNAVTSKTADAEKPLAAQPEKLKLLTVCPFRPLLTTAVRPHKYARLYNNLQHASILS
jgi:hypothetical protein